MDFAFPFSLDLSSKLWLAISAERLTAEDGVSLTIKRIRNFSLETCQVTTNLKAWKLPNENSSTFPLWNIKKLWCSRGEITHRVNAQTKSLAGFKAFRLIICETNRIYLNDVSTITQQEKNSFYISPKRMSTQWCLLVSTMLGCWGVLRRCPLAETKKGLRFPFSPETGCQYSSPIWKLFPYGSGSEKSAMHIRGQGGIMPLPSIVFKNNNTKQT